MRFVVVTLTEAHICTLNLFQSHTKTTAPWSRTPQTKSRIDHTPPPHHFSTSPSPPSPPLLTQYCIQSFGLPLSHVSICENLIAFVFCLSHKSSPHIIVLDITLTFTSPQLSHNFSTPNSSSSLPLSSPQYSSPTNPSPPNSPTLSSSTNRIHSTTPDNLNHLTTLLSSRGASSYLTNPIDTDLDDTHTCHFTPNGEVISSTIPTIPITIPDLKPIKSGMFGLVSRREEIELGFRNGVGGKEYMVWGNDPLGWHVMEVKEVCEKGWLSL
jgi:hypothetical protein